MITMPPKCWSHLPPAQRRRSESGLDNLDGLSPIA